MKSTIYFILVSLTLRLVSPTEIDAQQFADLHQFSPTDPTVGTNTDGVNPLGGLVLCGNSLYGTTYEGGEFGSGTIFAIDTNTLVFSVLHSFAGDNYNFASTEAAHPTGNLSVVSNMLYGTAYLGGDFSLGAVFRINTDGTGYTNIYSFSQTSGYWHPYGGVVLAGNCLYGVAQGAQGTIFMVNTDGTGYTNVFVFPGGADGTLPSSLILFSNTLFGTTLNGGTWGFGSVFAVEANGLGFTNLYSFGQDGLALDGTYDPIPIILPPAGLVLSGNTLYGTASSDWFSNQDNDGGVFKINTDGSGYAAIRYFNLADDESTPMAALIISGNTLYGTTESGIFAVNTDGTDLMSLHGFSSFSEGVQLQTSLILVGTTLYGTATEGGNYLHNQYDPGFSGFGTVFSVTLPPPRLTITLSGENAVLSWPANFTGYTLQSATNLISSVFWTDVPGQNTVTNRMSNLQTFYRLIKSSP